MISRLDESTTVARIDFPAGSVFTDRVCAEHNGVTKTASNTKIFFIVNSLSLLLMLNFFHYRNINVIFL